MNLLKRIIKILKYIVITLAILFTLILAVINLPFIQKIITSQTNEFFHDKNLPVKVGRIKLLVTGRIGLDEVQIIKETGDTIVSSEQVRISARIIPLMFKKLNVKNITVSNAVVNVTTDPVSGKLDIISMFTGNPKPQKIKGDQEKSGKKWDINIISVSLKSIKFAYKDSIKGILIDQSVGKLFVKFDEFSLINREIYAANVELKNMYGAVSLGNSSGKKQTGNKSASRGWKFQVRRSDLKDIKFTLHQPEGNERIDFSLDKGDISEALADLAYNRISVASLQLDEPGIALFSSNVESVIESKSIDTKTGGFPGMWKISGNNIKIVDGYFQTETYNSKSSRNDKSLPFKVSELNTTIEDVRLTRQESKLKINRLSFELNNRLRLNRGEISFSSDSTMKSMLAVNLLTAESKLNLKIEAENDLSFLIRSWHSALFSVNINDTEISAGEILSLLPVPGDNHLLHKKKTLKLGISLSARGTTNLMEVRYLNLKTSTGITLSASGKVADILKPDISSCSLEFNAGPVTREGLIELLQLSGSTVILPDFDPLTVKGTVNNTFMAPDLLLSMRSLSGNISIDGSVDLPGKIYNLKMSYDGLEVGKLTGISDLDKISGHFEIAGTEFVPDRLKVRVSAIIDSASYREYTYRGINAEINGDHGLYKFGLTSTDTSFKCDLTGTVVHNDSLDNAKISGMVSLDAGSLNLYRDLSASADIDGEISRTASMLNTSVSLRNLVVSISNQIENLQFVDLSFQSSDTGIKGMIKSDFLKSNFHIASSLADIKTIFKEGRFALATVLDSSAQKRIPYISSLPTTLISIESTYDPIVSLLLNDSIFSYHKISAEMIKDSSGSARTDILIDRFNFGSVSGFGANFHIGALPNKSAIMLSADSIRFGKIKLAGMQADISTAGDSAMYRFIAADKDNKPLYDLSGTARKSDGQVKLRSSKPEWVLNGFVWNVSPADFFILDPEDKDYIADLHWINDQRSIDISGRKSENLNLEFKNVGISTLLIPGMDDFGYDGELTGKIEYQGNKKTRLDVQMDIDRMRIAESVLGDLKINGNYLSDTTGKTESDFRVMMNDTSSLNLALNKEKKDGQMNFRTDFSGLPLGVFESFVKKYISGLEGEVSGNLSLTSGNGRPKLNGEIRISKTGLKIIPLNAGFYIHDDIIKLDNSNIVLNQFTVLDSLGKKLSLSGTIYLNDPADIKSDLEVRSDLLQVMNTTEKDNPTFYGSVFINTNLKVTGPVQKPAITGNIVLARGTIINYQYTEDLSVSETQKMITFASLSQVRDTVEIKQISSKPLSNGPDIEASIEIDRNSLFNFRISRGFEIGVTITGGGFLTYSMMSNKVMDLSGTYEINEGSSELKIPGWPRKDFIITPGSYLKWDGKVDDPELQVETTSKVRGSYINPVDGKNREVNFLVYMKLSGRLSQLEIIFDVRSEDQYITSVFNSLSKDERMRQAINLLIFGSIQLPNLSSSSDYMTQQINQFWESQINQITKSAIKSVDLSFGIDTYKGASEAGTEQTYTSLSYQVKKDMFKDRGSVLVSGHMNDNSPASQQSNSVIENFIFEYAIDTNRTKYVKVYRQQNYEDLLEGQVTKSGFGFIYRKSYDKLSDIWRRKKKTRKK